jgi:polysaccharide export outer membrane protein
VSLTIRTTSKGTRRAPKGALLGALGLALALPALSGCEVDDWLWNPSTVGRWEHTPTIVPILERIDVIESDTGDFTDVTEVTPEDLIPEPVEYRLAPGDFIAIEVWDVIQVGVPSRYDRSVDARGFVELPQLGRIMAEGLTSAEFKTQIENALINEGIVRELPLITVQVVGQRQQTFSVFGAISAPARYSIPYPNYRLLEALTDAGGVSPIIRNVYVIRQVPLSESVTRGVGRDVPQQRPTTPTTPSNGGDGPTNIEDLIRELANPEDPDGGVFGMSSMSASPSPRAAPAVFQDGDEPLIDLPDDDTANTARPVMDVQAPSADVQPREAVGKWVFMDGRWVRVMPAQAASTGGLPEGPDPLSGPTAAEDLITQRVIEVPVGPLLQGIAKYNIVVRPGDVIHVPSPQSGVVYVMGPGISRPGTYNLPVSGRLTIQRLVASAGGLSAIGIPERVDLTRMVGDESQATIRLNVRAIFEGTQPDLFLKPDDLVNFGTNFWATPLAVIRNGFRMSYGFGFLLDRNFGPDVFGPIRTTTR